MDFIESPDVFKLKSIYSALATNSDIVSSVPGFPDAVSQLKELLPLHLDNHYIEKNETQKELLIDTNNLTSLFIQLSKISKSLREIGIITENSELLDLPCFSGKKLLGKKCLADVLSCACSVLDTAKMYLEALDSYGIKNYHIIELKSRLQTLKKNNLTNTNKSAALQLTFNT